MSDKKKELNLIPEEQRVSSLGSKLLPIFLALIVVGVSVGVFVFLKATIFVQNENLKKINAEIEAKGPVWDRLKPVAASIKNVQSKFGSYEKTAAEYSGMDKKLDKLRELLPEGVALDTLDIDNKGKVAITGHSSSADSAYQYYNILKEQKEITSLSFESIAKTTSEYTFTLNFNLNLK